MPPAPTPRRDARRAAPSPLPGLLLGSLLVGVPATAEPGQPPDLAEARRLVEDGRIGEAAEHLEAVRRARPDDPAPLWMLAVARLRLGAFAEAAELGAALAALTPANPNGLFLRATALRELGEMDGAEAALREALDRDPAHPEARRDLALVLAARGRGAEAVRELEVLRAEHPGRAEVLAPLGVLLVQQGRGAEGLSALTAAAQSDPGSFEAQHHLGALHSRLGSFGEADRRLAAALALRPGDPGALLEICLLRSREERLEAAKAACERAADAAPGNAEAHFRSGDVLHYLREDADAEARYRETLRLDPQHRRARFRLGALLHETGRSAEAIPVLRPALPAPGEAANADDDPPGTPETREQQANARVILGLALARTGEREAALAEFREAAAEAPLVPEPHLHLGNLLARSEVPEEAAAGREHLERFAELKGVSDRTNELKTAIVARPGEGAPKRALVAHLIENGAADLAAAESERLLTLAPAEPLHHLLYAEALEALGEDAAAREVIERALADWPDREDLRAAAERFARER